MASRKTFAKPNFLFPSSPATMISDSESMFEFDESDIWSESSPASQAIGMDSRKWIPTKSRANPIRSAAISASSLPVNVPDWSKILKKKKEEESEIGDRRWNSGGDSDDDVEIGDRIPPHEYLARMRGASLSVHEGIGRTLKGRDLRRVRNAIWKQVGFED